MPMPTEREHLLQICRAVMPGVAGVVLSTLQGHVVAHESARVADPAAVATHAAAHLDPAAQTSALVNHGGDLYLVVFVPPPLFDQLASSAPAALPA
jgi:predicted regulator of Ras-like GTPase activity (Roadblock/LC7/MglB family)